MWEHSTGVRIDDEQVLKKTAQNLAELHQARFLLAFKAVSALFHRFKPLLRSPSMV